MTNVLKLPQLAWHGTKAMELPLPDSWQVEMCHMAGYDRPTLTPDQIRAAVTQNLIGTPPIREIAKGKKEVVIIFDDNDQGDQDGRHSPLRARRADRSRHTR